MAIVIGVFMLLFFIGVISSIISKLGGVRNLFSGSLKLLGPYVGFFIISGLVFIMGQAAGTINRSLVDVFSYAAQVLAVLTALVFCLHLIVIVFRKIF